MSPDKVISFLPKNQSLEHAKMDHFNIHNIYHILGAKWFIKLEFISSFGEEKPEMHFGVKPLCDEKRSPSNPS